MRTFPSDGLFAERPFFDDAEIERIATDELGARGLLPDSPSPIRIERFIEKRFGITPTYEDLEGGILGYTRFGSRGVEEIVVSRSLGEEGTAVSERRVTTTLAHEVGHGVLHAHLFVMGAFNHSLFNDDDVMPSRVLCRDPRDTAAGRRPYDGRWWEFQANLMMGALLLPRRLVIKCVQPLLEQRGNLGVLTLPSHKREAVARLLSETFDVNPAVGRIRLARLFPDQDQTQLTL
jgi:hypothetical protein